MNHLPPRFLWGSFRKLAFSLWDPMIMCWKDAWIGCFFSFFWYFSWGILFLKYIKTIVKCHQLVKFSKRVASLFGPGIILHFISFLHKIDMFWFILDCKNVFIEIKMFLLMLCYFFLFRYTATLGYFFPSGFFRLFWSTINTFL